MKYTPMIFLGVTATSCVLFTIVFGTFQQVPTRPSAVQPDTRSSKPSQAGPGQATPRHVESKPVTPKPTDESQQAAAAWQAIINGVRADISKVEATMTTGDNKPEKFDITILRDDAKKSDSLKHAYVGELTLRDHSYMGRYGFLGDIHATNERTYRFGWTAGRWRLLEYRVTVIMAPIRSEIGVSVTVTNLSRLDRWEKLLLQAAL